MWLGVGGVASAALGLVALFAPGATLTVLAIVLSLWLIVTGLARVGLASAMRAWSPTRRGVQGGLGVALAAGGTAGLLGTWNALTLVTLVVAIGFLLAAAADLTLALTGPRGLGRFASGALGVLHLVIGLTFLFLPEMGLSLLAVLVGLALLGLGAVQLGAAALIRALVNRADSMAQRLGPRRPGDDGDDPRIIRGEVL